MSEKSETVWNRRPALVGLRLRRGMGRLSALEEVDAPAGGEGDDGPLGVGTAAEGLRLAVALALALAVQGVHLGHLDAEDGLDRVGDLDLGGPGVDDERVHAVVEQPVGLLAHHRADDHGPGVVHSAASSPSVAVGAASGSAAGAGARASPAWPGSVARVKTTQSEHSTS